MPPAAILDVDGTLVDTNYHHALAWYRAFRRHGLTLPVWRIHRHIGMGGDQLVAAVAGEEAERRDGDGIRAAESDLYAGLIGEVRPFADARRLLELLDRRGHRIVLASSARPEEVDHYLDLLDRPPRRRPGGRGPHRRLLRPGAARRRRGRRVRLDRRALRGPGRHAAPLSGPFAPFPRR